MPIDYIPHHKHSEETRQAIETLLGVGGQATGRKKLSHAEIAKQLGIPRRSVSKIAKDLITPTVKKYVGRKPIRDYDAIVKEVHGDFKLRRQTNKQLAEHYCGFSAYCPPGVVQLDSDTTTTSVVNACNP